jgi:hypothetical protein
MKSRSRERERERERVAAAIFKAAVARGLISRLGLRVRVKG